MHYSLLSLSSMVPHSQSYFSWFTCMHCSLPSVSCGVTFTIFALSRHVFYLTCLPCHFRFHSQSPFSIIHSLLFQSWLFLLCCFKSTLLLFSLSLLFSSILISMMEKKTASYESFWIAKSCDSKVVEISLLPNLSSFEDKKILSMGEGEDGVILIYFLR